MLRGLFVFGSVLAVLGASFYQLWLKEFLAVTVGVGRIIQTIEEFPYSCRRFEHKRLEACEDLWLDDDARVLYAACAGSQHRIEWNQAYVNYTLDNSWAKIYLEWTSLMFLDDVPEELN